MKRQTISAEEALVMIQERFAAGQQASLLVTGTSMVPFLRHNKDWVRLSPIDGVPKTGQILLFTQGERLVLHRLRNMRDGKLYMNGDGRMDFEIIAPEQVVAVVTHILRRGGRVIDCRSLWFRGLSTLWQGIRPLRPALLKLVRRIKGKGEQDL